MKKISLKVFLFIALLLASATQPYAQGTATGEGTVAGIPTDPEAIAAGGTLFKNNCTSCHSISNEVVVGPGLKDIHSKRPLPWLISFIRNSQKVIQSGDKYAVDLYNKFGGTQMPSHDFSDAEITNILAYIQAESTKKAETAVVDGGAGQTQEGGLPNEYITAILVALLVVLALVLIVLFLIITVLTKYLTQRTDLDEDDKEIISQKFDLAAVLKNRAFLGLVVFVFVAIAGKLSLDGLYGIGVSQGYAPKQPIAFSHKLHAGEYQIDCNYCHTGAQQTKAASIPSANVCMNCHNTIKIESPEIKKIYAAIENDEPIQWVRVHNLPDLAYFNHSQHANVGGIECQTCHGPIQEMEVVQQYSPLTMGWCISCHRQTAINAEGNEYYDKLVALHKSGKKPLKVEDIGGLECSKCHY